MEMMTRVRFTKVLEQGCKVLQLQSECIVEDKFPFENEYGVSDFADLEELKNILEGLKSGGKLKVELVFIAMPYGK